MERKGRERKEWGREWRGSIWKGGRVMGWVRRGEGGYGKERKGYGGEGTGADGCVEGMCW